MKNIITFICFFTCGVCFAGHSYESKVEDVALAGPAAVISYPMMVMAAQQPLINKGVKFSFTRWKNPQQLRAMVVGKQVDFTAMPSNLAATFYNRGHHLNLLNVAIWDIMSVVTRAENYRGGNVIEQLVGKEIVVPFKNDMPSIVLEQLLTAQLGKQASEVKIRQSHNFADSAQLLLAGQVHYALLIEPLTSIVLFQNKQQGKKKLVRALNISEAWQQTFPNSPKLPQAGLVANTSVNLNKALVNNVNHAYSEAALWCQQNVDACADIVTRYLPKMPKPALVQAIKNTGLDIVPAQQARPHLESFYRLLANIDAKRIGKKLPDSDFYWK